MRRRTGILLALLASVSLLAHAADDKKKKVEKKKDPEEIGNREVRQGR
jgi:hypothetical protein